MVRLHKLKVELAIAFAMILSPAFSQTYQVNPGTSTRPSTQNGQAQKPGQQLGWGSNIENARLARAAQLALQRGDHALALDYAQRAAQSAPNDPQMWFLLGYAARLNDRYGQSVEAYKHGLQLAPSSINGTSGLAQTYSLMGRKDEAERLLKQVLASDPGRKDDLFILGDLYVRSGDYTNAVEWLAKAERADPAARSELLLAICYERLNQMDQASHYLGLARSRSPNNPDVQRSLASFYRETSDYSHAISELKSIHNPKPNVVAELGYTYELAGKLEESAQSYAQAADALPQDLNLQLSAAQAQVAVGSMDRADSFLDRASKLDPNYYRLHAIRGDIAQRENRYSDAIHEYSAAVAQMPSSPTEGPLYPIQLHMNLVALYQEEGDADLEHKQLQIAQAAISNMDERGADRAQFLRLRALVKMNAGEEESALDDMKESLALSPHDLNSLQIDGDLLMKMGRPEDAIVVYKKILAADPKNRFALASIGYASRATGNDRDAEKYFELLAKNDPSLYIPWLALGDMYTASGDYKKAQAAYSRGYAAAPQNALIVAGGMNAAIESHDLALAGAWLHRTTAKMEMVPQVLREKERYFSFTGDVQQSAELGHEAIKVLPHDRDVVVYLGYDLLRLEEYEELLALTRQYEDVFPKEPDIPLLAGYVYKHNRQLEQAAQEFTEALNRDPNVVTAYVNRGYVRNDLHQPEQAAADFEQALKREPKNGEAHLGYAVAELNLNHPQIAVRQTQLAEAESGDSELLHLIRATAYGREGQLSKSADEYQAALKFDPKNGLLYLDLGNIYFAQQHYREAVAQLQAAQSFQPENASIYALMARADANLQDREATMRNIQLAEKYAVQDPSPSDKTSSQQNTVSEIYVSTGEALSTLGDEKGAMDRFSKALVAPGSNRVSIRLAIAHLMAQQGHSADAERQIALTQMESAVGDAKPPTGEQYIEAADIFQQMHEYELSQSYLQRAKSAGASDIHVRVAMANNYLALGETTRAAAELAAVKQTDGSATDYQYLLAEAAVYQQEHHNTQALSAFAAAANAAGEDQTAEQDLIQAGGNEGIRINPAVSLMSNLAIHPIFEDSTVYVLDSKLDSPNGPVPVSDVAALPPPRSSIETDWTTAYHLHLFDLPLSGGFFQLRNARGDISVPATNSIVHRNTTDYTMNFGVAPTARFGSNVLTFNTGIQGTIRRDSLSPVQMNQNLFRAFAYVSTSSFFNVVSADGFIIHESGPFTESPIDEHATAGAVDFRVGAPWGRTALITGWGLNHQHFISQQRGNSENYYTSSYIGLAHKFGTRLDVQAIAEDLRAWRIVPFSPIHSAIAQALRPAGTIDFSASRNWGFQVSTSYENTRGFHVYDMLQNSFALSYTRPFGRTFNDETGEVKLKYPIRISAGIQTENFLNFTQGQSQQFRPYVSVTLF